MKRPKKCPQNCPCCCERECDCADNPRRPTMQEMRAAGLFARRADRYEPGSLPMEPHELPDAEVAE